MTIKYTTLGLGNLDKCAEWQVVDCARWMFTDRFNLGCILLRVREADTNCMCSNVADRLVEDVQDLRCTASRPINQLTAYFIWLMSQLFSYFSRQSATIMSKYSLV